MANPISEIENAGRSTLRSAWHFAKAPLMLAGGLSLIGVMSTVGFAGVAGNIGSGLEFISEGISKTAAYVAPKLAAAGTAVAGMAPAPT